MSRSLFTRAAGCVGSGVLCALTMVAAAQVPAHVHGLVGLNAAVDGRTLTLQLEAPLDSLLGFEHRPRTEAQRRAAAGLLERLQNAQTMLKPSAAAQCSLTKNEVESEALKPAPGAAPAARGGEEHADLDARFEFDCAQPDRLSGVDIGLFDAFPRIRRIDAQIAGAKGQSKQTLTKSNRVLRLAR